jgi:hypothetical protein
VYGENLSSKVIHASSKQEMNDVKNEEVEHQTDDQE